MPMFENYLRHAKVKNYTFTYKLHLQKSRQRNKASEEIWEGWKLMLSLSQLAVAKAIFANPASRIFYGWFSADDYSAAEPDIRRRLTGLTRTRTRTMNTRTHGTSTSLEPLVFNYLCFYFLLIFQTTTAFFKSMQLYSILYIAQCSACEKCATHQHFQQKFLSLQFITITCTIHTY